VVDRICLRLFRELSHRKQSNTGRSSSEAKEEQHWDGDATRQTLRVTEINSNNNEQADAGAEST